MRAVAANEEEAKDIDDRVKAMEEVIDREVKVLNEVTSENNDLRAEIINLKSQFEKKAFENEVSE